MLAIPQTFEQDMLSRRIHELGAGIRLPQSQVAPDSIRLNSLGILSDATFQESSRDLGEACRKAGGAKRAVDAIFAHLKISCLDSNAKEI